MGRVMERATAWVGVVSERLGPLSKQEEALAMSASLTILDGWEGNWEAATEQREGDALGAVTAMVELARSMAAGAPLRRAALA